MDPSAANMLTNIGIMNKISTGNMVLDVLACLMMPLLLQQFMPFFQRFQTWLQTTRQARVFTRVIGHTKRQGWYWRDDDEPPNNLLQQAILMYLGSKPDLTQKYYAAALDLVKKGREPKEKKASKGDDDSECSSDDSDAYDTSRQLKTFRVNTVPPENCWVDVEDGLSFMRSESHQENDGGKRTDTIISFTLRSYRPNGQKLIDGFVTSAFEYYKEQMEAKSENLRYLYTPLNQGSGEEEKAGVIYKRYQLSDEKTFNSLFHPDKESLLRLVEHFTAKSGKYAIPGYAHKMGLLLHGPPGTGKTSLIKALAHHTGRSIISIPLSKIKTNQELMDIVFDQIYKVQGEDLPINLSFAKTCFVMEDVDAACSVVRRRSRPTTTTEQVTVVQRCEGGMVRATSTRQTSTSSPTAGVGRSDLDHAADAAVAATKGEEEEGAEAGGSGQVMQGPLLPDGSSGLADGLKIKGLSGFDNPDKLNLAGLLNVLDGVVDTPNRIVIMTTNHPEKLDPALIRPGRINKKIYMGYLRLAEAQQMLQHYFCGQVDAEAVAAIARIFPVGTMTPAELEMLCCDADTVGELIENLAQRQGCSS